jgi:DNA polymerase (family 10)
LPAIGNGEIASILFRIADLLELQGVEWKPRAFRAAASAIESMPEQASALYKKGGARALEEIPGVGRAIAEKMEELFTTGKLRYFEELKKNSPMDPALLDAVPGIGPKKLRLLHKALAIATLRDLKSAAQKHLIVGIPGFGEKSEQGILEALEKGGVKAGRISYSKALPIATCLLAKIRAIPFVERAEIAGSFRRKRETIGDLDILVCSKKPALVAEAIVSLPGVKSVLASGEKKTSVVLQNGLQVDFRAVPPEQWGSALLYFTGGKAHSIALRRIAIKKGLKLSEYGLFRGNRAVASKTEKDVYNALGMGWIRPESRENEGEIEMATNGFGPRKK